MKKNIVLLVIGFSFIMQACNNSQKKITITVSNAVLADSSEASCPWLTKDNHGNMVLSWIRKIDSSTSVYCYAVSKDHGKSFGKAIVIPGSSNIHPHGENMPKIIFKPSGEIIAAWASANANPKNGYSDEVFYSKSFDDGATWSKATKLVTDTAGYDQRYFDLAILSNGEAAIIWLDNRKKTPHDGSALYFATTKDTSGFKNERLIAQPCCPCCRTDLFVDKEKNIHLLYRAIIRDSIRDMEHIISTDNGKTFSAPQRISDDNWVVFGCPHTGPAMTENKNGIQFTWFTGGQQGGIYYCNSSNEGKSFSLRSKVSGLQSKHCQVSSMANNNIAIVWDESFSKGNNYFSRIGFEIRNAKGSDPVKKYITRDNDSATFPAIKGIDKNTVIVAYTVTENNKDRVKYKIVRFT
ncbi:MAG: sialidase family protein [Ginsengibacter sp.]